MFNVTMQEFCARLAEAFPSMPEIKHSQSLLASTIQLDPALPAKTFASQVAPFRHMIAAGDFSFLDGPASPLQAFGMQSAWECMHPVTRTAVAEYISKLAKYAGIMTPPTAMANPASMDPAMINNLLSLARDATMKMSEEDAKDLLTAGRDPNKLGALCYSIIDSLTRV